MFLVACGKGDMYFLAKFPGGNRGFMPSNRETNKYEVGHEILAYL